MNTEFLISQYIDNELSLDEKITFVQTVHDAPDFKEEALDLLELEKQLTLLPVHDLPVAPKIERASSKENSWFVQAWWKTFAGLAVAGAVAGLLIMTPQPKPSIQSEPHRFVVYLPDVQQAQIIGTFTDWQPVSMTSIGTSGYWTLTLDIPLGGTSLQLSGGTGPSNS
nr:hypothetical protein [uncultured Desulfobulbus sp.]